MTSIAHLSAMPVEELMLPLACGGGALWLAARTWLLGPFEGTRTRMNQGKERR